MKALCSIFGLHVLTETCDYLASIKTPFREVLHDRAVRSPVSDRMACQPENFTKAGFFFSCREYGVRLAYSCRAKAPVTRQDINGNGGRRLEPVGSVRFLALSLVRSICDGMAPTRMYKRGCDLHGNGFACSEIHQRGYLKTGDVK